MHNSASDELATLTAKVCVGAIGYVIGAISENFTDIHGMLTMIIGLLIMAGAAATIWHSFFVSWRKAKREEEARDESDS